MERVYVYDNHLMSSEGAIMATFSSHWAACAAMIRLHTPDFKSLGTDKPEDLAIEKALREQRT